MRIWPLISLLALCLLAGCPKPEGGDTTTVDTNVTTSDGSHAETPDSGSAPLSMEKLKGKVVLLDFWATWCVPCIAQFPTLRQWQEKYGPRGLVIVGVTNHSSQTSEDVRAYLAKDKLPWPIAIDTQSRTHMDFGVSPIPHTFVIDQAGNVVLSHIGGKNIVEIEKKIEATFGLW